MQNHELGDSSLIDVSRILIISELAIQPLSVCVFSQIDFINEKIKNLD